MSTRRTLAAITLAVAAPFALSACGTSFGAQTNQQYQAAVGSNLRTGPIGVYNGLFVDNADGTATFSGGLLSTEDQTIESVTVDGAAKKLARPITLKPNTLLTLGAAGEIVVKSDIAAGDYVTISFAATPGGDVSIEVPVVARTEMYADVAKRPTSEPKPVQEQESDPAAPESEDGDEDTSPPSS
ncbi:hypothetical protein [Aeromicrobium choanae]|uniref:Copper(I)-binding protein n=1 Tax=Aeromicrobium choanae TaxID=1736691 RepID=A0A1T4Z1W1_9ACTN|nr:hypothetical protein [Aeromicrobium choanae]SKB08030.1 hypothetical protein SAMN06295964_1945 [Aeromicrobium choanae]